MPRRPSSRALSLLLLLAACGAPALHLAACGAPPAPIVLTPPPPDAPSASAPLAAESASAPLAAGSASAAQVAEVVPEEEGPNNLAGTIDTDIPTAPCDLDRPYRGEIGKSVVSVILARSGTGLRGATAYDGNTGEIELAGSVGSDGKFTLTERKDKKDLATMKGTCEANTGTLVGTWNQGAVTKEFRLRPRPAGGIGIAQLRKQIGKASEDTPSCTWDVRSPVVFGLGSAEKAGRINAALRLHFFHEADLEREVLACGPKSDKHATGWYSIEANKEGLLSVLLNGYLYFGPAVHGEWNAGGTAVSIDIPTGRQLRVKDVVTSSKALRPVVQSCMEFAGKALEWNEWELERALQGVAAEEGAPSTIREPSILVLPEGLVVLIRNMSTVGAFYEFQGIVVRWGALLRAGILAPRSPVARLWANQKALAAGEPACDRLFIPRWLTKKTKSP